jgi:large subunit ribosomal protein L32
MAAPQNRHTIEVNRCRRGNPQKLIKIKNNIDICPECGYLKQKHVLCDYCYEKVRQETTKIRQQIGAQEGGPFEALPLRLWYCTQERNHKKRIRARGLLKET